MFGILEAIESVAGLVGPTLGGVLSRLEPMLVLVTVLLVYLSVFVAVLRYYRYAIVTQIPSRLSQKFPSNGSLRTMNTGTSNGTATETEKNTDANGNLTTPAAGFVVKDKEL